MSFVENTPIKKYECVVSLKCCMDIVTLEKFVSFCKSHICIGKGAAILLIPINGGFLFDLFESFFYVRAERKVFPQ